MPRFPLMFLDPRCCPRSISEEMERTHANRGILIVEGGKISVQAKKVSISSSCLRARVTSPSTRACLLRAGACNGAVGPSPAGGVQGR